MSDFEFSTEAKCALPLFDIDARKIRVFVEGIDDIPFWENIFSNIVPEEYGIEISEVGGCQELYKLLNAASSKQDFIVAADSEYDEILNDKIKYKNALTMFTKRHSIENYLFCKNSIIRTISRMKRGQIQKHEQLQVDEFIKKLSLLLEKLLYLDCLKSMSPEKFPSSLKIMGGDSCIGSLTNNSIYPLQDKIVKFIKDNKLDSMDTRIIESKFKDKNLYHFINGHFTKLSIQKFISAKVASRNISDKQLYEYTYDSCILCKQPCDDYKHIQLKAQKAVEIYLKMVS